MPVRERGTRQQSPMSMMASPGPGREEGQGGASGTHQEAFGGVIATLPTLHRLRCPAIASRDLPFAAASRVTQPTGMLISYTLSSHIHQA